MAANKARESQPGGALEGDARERILQAAFAAFTEKGYAVTSTREIASRARVSKRELYALVGNKQQMLVSCISARALRLRLPADLPIPKTAEELEQALVALGSHLFREITDPTVVAVFRLAIAEAVNAPEVAAALDSVGRETSRGALRQIMSSAMKNGVLPERNPAELADQFSGLLWGNTMLALLLGVESRPSVRDVQQRARRAAAALLKLNA